MKPILLLLAGLFLLGIGFGAAADVYSDINRLRSGDGRCDAVERLLPLKVEPALERVARQLSRGGKLAETMKASDYRSLRSVAFSIIGAGVGSRAAEVLSRRNQCKQLQAPGMSAVGVYVDDGQIWVVLAAPFAPTVGVSQLAAGQTVLMLVNQARAVPRACGDKSFGAAAPVRWNDTLANVARVHAEDMAHYHYFSHTGRDGSSPAQRVERGGYRYRTTGENIAAGPTMKAEDAVAGWIKSPGHCANLMNPAYTEMGLAYGVDAKSEMGIYWGQVFATPR